MAHSNRQKKKDARGGMTKNQSRKANKTTSQGDRLRSVIEWYEKKNSAPATVVSIKKKKYNTKVSTQRRREVAYNILLLRVKIETNKDKLIVMNRELETLKSRLSA